MNKKDWRLGSEEDFCTYLDIVLNSRLKYILNYKPNVIYPNRMPSSKTQIINVLNNNLNGRIYGDIPKNLSIKYKKIMLRYKCQLVECDMECWSDESFKPTNLKTLIAKLIADYLFDTKMVCISFLCTSPFINYDMIKDIMFIYSGLFDFDIWDDKHVDAVVEHAKLYGTKAKYIDNQKILKLFKEEKMVKTSLDGNTVQYKKFNDRLDWNALLNNSVIDNIDIEELAKSLAERTVGPYFQQNTL